MSTQPSRASDPGIRLSQIPGPDWVQCPRCSGAARFEGNHTSCLNCGFSSGGALRIERRPRRLVLLKNNPRCTGRHCGGPIPTEGTPAERRYSASGILFAKVRCPTCGHVGRYPARQGVDKRHMRDRKSWPRSYPLYLHRSIGAHTLWIYNLNHLALLEDWLGAELRERGPVAGLTMMARLPAWMKAASARPRILRALAEMREQALREGLS